MAGPKNAGLSGDGAELAYLAGFFDGEGSIYMKGTLQVSASQVDVRPLRMLVTAFGGSVGTQDRSPNRPVSYWRIYGRPAAEALSCMLPWLVVKADEAKLGLQYQETIGPLGNRFVSDANRLKRSKVRTLLLQLRTASWNRKVV